MRLFSGQFRVHTNLSLNFHSEAVFCIGSELISNGFFSNVDFGIFTFFGIDVDLISCMVGDTTVPFVMTPVLASLLCVVCLCPTGINLKQTRLSYDIA